MELLMESTTVIGVPQRIIFKGNVATSEAHILNELEGVKITFRKADFHSAPGERKEGTVVFTREE